MSREKQRARGEECSIIGASMLWWCRVGDGGGVGGGGERRRRILVTLVGQGVQLNVGKESCEMDGGGVPIVIGKIALRGMGFKD